jgi:cytochrome c oxidase subunit II
MIFQNGIWLISLLGMGLITLGFIYVVALAGAPADAVQTDRFHRTAPRRL